MICGSSRDGDLFPVRKLTENDVSDEQANERIDQWLGQASEHAGELVVAFSALDGMTGRGGRSTWPVHVGIVADDIEDTPEVRSNLYRGIAVTDSGSIASKGGEVKPFENIQIRLGLREAYNSFQTYEPFLRTDSVPVFQVAFGEAAVAQWFIDNQGLPGAIPYQYFRMAKMLGFGPSRDPVIQESVNKRILSIFQTLTQSAVGQRNLKDRIDAVYGSIGQGVRSVMGGQALEMAPEGVGEANLRTYSDRQKALHTDRAMSKLKDELVMLDVDEQAFYVLVAESLGLSLLPDIGACDTAKASITEQVEVLNNLDPFSPDISGQEEHDEAASTAFGEVIKAFNSLPERCRMSSDGIGCFNCQSCGFNAEVK